MREIVRDWRVFVFGSAASGCTCLGGFNCSIIGSDIDLLVVYPRAEWRLALHARQSVRQVAFTHGFEVDVVLLNFEEEAETNFAIAERGREI